MNRRLIAVFLAGALLAAPVAIVKAADNDSDQSQAYSSDFDDFLGFVGGVPLNAAERELVQARTVADLRSDPIGVQHTDETMRKELAKLHDGDASFVGEQREAFRLQIALLPASNLGRQIVERNDPTIVFDEKHHRLITEGSLSALQRVCTWISQLLDLPGPDSKFVAVQRTRLHRDYNRLPDAQQEALAHVQRDVPLLIAAYDKSNQTKQAQFAKAVRPYARDRTKLAPLSVALLGATHAAVQNQIINDSIVLMGQTNNAMLYHGGYYHNF